MDRIDKSLKKFNNKESKQMKAILCSLFSGNCKNFDIRKLRGRSDNIFRLKKGSYRIIYKKDKNGIQVLKAGKRNEGTYRNF
jgi:mRNA-degrading endonuclease RelE of RelBE toxin-antitoxin system